MRRQDGCEYKKLAHVFEETMTTEICKVQGSLLILGVFEKGLLADQEDKRRLETSEIFNWSY